MDKITLHLKADEQILTSAECPFKLASNTVSYVEAVFELGENWTGYDSVRAVWTTYLDTIATVLDSEGKCVVPHEVLTRTGKVSVNLVGSIVEDEELTDRLTTYPTVALNVNADAYVEGTETAPITPSQFEQYVADVAEEVAKIKDLESTTLNDDYTLTFVFSDGTSTTVGPIRGEQGEQGIQGPQGPEGPPGEVTMAQFEEAFPTDTASGAIASFPDGTDLFGAKSLVVEINPIQDTSGGDPSPSNICPISGWNSVGVVDDPVYGGFINWNQYAGNTMRPAQTKNSVQYTPNNDGTFTLNGTADSDDYWYVTPYDGAGQIVAGHKYIFWDANKNGSATTFGLSLGGTIIRAYGDTRAIVTASSSTNVLSYCYKSGAVINNAIIKPVLVDLTLLFGAGNEPTTVDEFKALFPNDYYAYNAGTKTNVSAVNNGTYESYSVTLPTTTYGGSVDLVSGVLTITHQLTTISSWSGTFGQRTYGYCVYKTLVDRKKAQDSICNMFKRVGINKNVDDMKLGEYQGGSGSDTTWSFILPSTITSLTEANNWLTNLSEPLVVTETLATPQTVQLSAQTIAILKATNNIFADSGNVSVTYKADTQLWVEKKLSEL